MSYRVLLVTLFIAFTKVVAAQHCTWDSYGALIFDIRDAKTSERVGGLTVRLVDSSASTTLGFGQQRFFEARYSRSRSQPALYANVNLCYTVAVEGKDKDKSMAILVEDNRSHPDSSKYKAIYVPVKSEIHHLCVSRFPKTVETVAPQIIYISKEQ